MKKTLLAVLLILSPLFLLAQGTIEKIEIQGNVRITRENIMFQLSIREGDYYSEDVLKKDLKVLWSTGFFSDVRIEEEDGRKGKIVRIIVVENPIVKNVTYKTGKKVKADDITNKLKEKDEIILPDSSFSQSRMMKVKKTIGDLLAEKGLPTAKIDAEVHRRGKNEVDIAFKIDEGPKVRVGEVLFEGGSKLPQSFFREAMKDNKTHSLFSWIGGKDVFKQGKLTDDISLIKKKLQEAGYMEAVVGEPRTEVIERKTIFFRKKRMMRIVIPVRPGYLYRLGDIKIEGNKVINSKGLRGLIKLEKGDVYSTKVREDAVKKMGEIYTDGGYLYVRVGPNESLDPVHKIVNLSFNIEEGEVSYLNRLVFKGNNYTKDKVIRREMGIREGDRFMFSRFKDSVLRIKQLGLVDLDGDPKIDPTPDDPNKLDVVVNVKELQRNNIQFTAGYSGYQGTFVQFSYSTVNFLGAGESLDFTIQTGKRIKNYSFGFTEPYIFDKPMSIGFKVFDTKVDYPYLYNQKSKGASLVFGTRLIEFWQANVTYSYQNVNVTIPEDSLYYSYYSNSYFGVGNYNISSIEPRLYRTTVNHPLTPTGGTMYSLAFKYAGTFLGGEIDLYKPSFEFTHFQRIVAQHVLGVHLSYEFVKSLRNSDIPFWEKFYLGGERSVRGYEIYTIGPRNSSNTILGGEKSLYMNLEYNIPVGGPLNMIFFYDMGNAIASGDKFSMKSMYSSAGIEARIFVPALRVPFRLIFAYNNRKIYTDDSNFAFRFAVGPTF